MAARLKRHIQCSTCGALTSVLKSDDFGVRATEFLVPSFADHCAIANNDASNHRIRFDRAFAADGQFEGSGHIALIVFGA
jgi:hypothetical protein